VDDWQPINQPEPLPLWYLVANRLIDLGFFAVGLGAFALFCYAVYKIAT
jgi:hypothetical protein